MKINALKINIHTLDGNFGTYIEFTKGLNIIRGNNSTGKSTLFQSIIYALGFEELLRGRNEETMQYVLKDKVISSDGQEHQVLQSSVIIEIENSLNQVITIRRYVKNTAKGTKLIDVSETKSLTKQEPALFMSKWIHDKGGASNEDYGFHYYLAKFLGWELPDIVDKQGNIVHLYIQLLAPAFIIEQKIGWSDFLATMPIYGIKQTKGRVIEYLLNLDVFETIKKKQESKNRENILKEEWKKYYYELCSIAKDCRFELYGITDSPELLEEQDIKLLKPLESGFVDIETELGQLRHEYEDMIQVPTMTIGENVEIMETKINDKKNNLKTRTVSYNLLFDEVSNYEQQLRTYKEQLDEIERDLYKNKGALKIQKLGGNIGSSIANCKCPTCNQEIKDSLLPSDVKEIPMRLEENIEYLESQKKMINAYIEGQSKVLDYKKRQLSQLNYDISSIRSDIRNMELELIKDPRQLSEIEIVKKVELNKKIEFFKRKKEEFDDIKYKICNDFKEKYTYYLKNEKDSSKEPLSEKDKQKLRVLCSRFKSLLQEFGYSSKSTNSISISDETYLPIIDGYDIRYDSSASDFVRCIWAYSIALMETSKEVNGNHPNMLIFDEPKQQDAAIEDFKLFICNLAQYTDEQIIVFASFEDNDQTFKEITNGLKFNYKYIKGKMIQAEKK